MMTPEARRRRVPIAELYVVLCAGLAALVALGIAPTTSVPALLVLMLPAAIVGFVVVLNLVALAEGFPPDSWAWPLAFVVVVAVLAWLQVRMVRAIARNWHAPVPDIGT